MTLHSYQSIQNAIMPLRLIFWGGLLSVFDLTFTGNWWRFDVLSDMVGLVMIVWAVYRLGRFEVHRSYQLAMRFVLMAAVLACFKAAHDHFIYATPAAMDVTVSVIGVLAMAATVVFCFGMKWLCRRFDLDRSERSWKVTAVLFVCVYAIPHGLFCIVAAIAAAIGSPIDLELGRGMILVVAIFALPLIHLFLSTSRMQRDIQSQVSKNAGH